MQVLVSGIAGPLTVAALTPTTITFHNVALQPTLTGLNALTGGAPIALTLTAYDPTLDQASGLARIGGDTITIGPKDAQSSVLGGPQSPLVVYGDTSQDGVWYAGHSDDTLGYEFGPKPFDPFWMITDDQNEDDEWVFPLADPYTDAGNDVIDARALYADIGCDATCSNLPTVGFTAYGGEGDELFRQPGRRSLAGGSGTTRSTAPRVDHTTATPV